VIGRLVRRVAVRPESTFTGSEEVLADGDFVGVVSETALRAKRAGTCTMGQLCMGGLTGKPGAISVVP